MRRKPAVLIILALFSAVFVLGQFLFVPKTYVNSAVVQALQAPRVFLSALRNRIDLMHQLTAAQIENQSLRAQLEMALSRPEFVRDGARQYLAVPVYSVYPLNNDNHIVVAAGASEGVQEGMVVLAEPGIFLGEVAKVYAHQSEVRTIYDPGWELPVKIGPDRLDSLLVGGREPQLTLISKKKPAAAGMNAYTAAKKYPYSLLLGTMGDPADSEQNLFQEASLQVPYVLSDLSRVYILEAH